MRRKSLLESQIWRERERGEGEPLVIEVGGDGGFKILWLYICSSQECYLLKLLVYYISQQLHLKHSPGFNFVNDMIYHALFHCGCESSLFDSKWCNLFLSEHNDRLLNEMTFYIFIGSEIMDLLYTRIHFLSLVNASDCCI